MADFKKKKNEDISGGKVIRKKKIKKQWAEM